MLNTLMSMNVIICIYQIILMIMSLALVRYDCNVYKIPLDRKWMSIVVDDDIIY